MTRRQPLGIPYGFRLEPSSKEIAVVRRIFRWHTDGLSLREIAGRLNDKHVPTKTRAASGWQAETIRLILNNRELYGPHLRGVKR
jgi:hypothetical protein